MNVAYVQLARYGDLMNLLPLLKQRYDGGEECHVYCCRQFADLFDGVSYATAHALDCTVHDLAVAAAAAEAGGHDRIIVSQYDRNPLVSRCTSVSFAHAQWELAREFASNALAGYDDPLLFDRRHRDRERELRLRLDAERLDRPLLLVNLKGFSSPYRQAPELLNRLQARYGRKWCVIDLSQVEAFRIFDLLGLYERARALVTIDTATYHLANAANVRTILVHPAAEQMTSPIRAHVIHHTTHDRAIADYAGICQAIDRI